MEGIGILKYLVAGYVLYCILSLAILGRRVGGVVIVSTSALFIEFFISDYYFNLTESVFRILFFSSFSLSIFIWIIGLLFRLA